MFGKVIGSHEALIANGASEALLARVSAQMALEFVGARETFAAKEPLAAERPFARVPTKMRFQVRRFSVDFTASGNVTEMLFLFVLTIVVASDDRSCSWILNIQFEIIIGYFQSAFIFCCFLSS